MRLPADHDEITGDFAEQDVVLGLRVLCGTGHAEAHVPVRGSVGRAPCEETDALGKNRNNNPTQLLL